MPKLVQDLSGISSTSSSSSSLKAAHYGSMRTSVKSMSLSGFK
ncbi:MAG: hypothetical protein WCK51_02310 [Armatimonadota bacterium]